MESFRDPVDGELVVDELVKDVPGTGLQPWVKTGPTPASVYLLTLGESSRGTMREALRNLARMATNGSMDEGTMPWHLLCYADTMALRAKLADKYGISSIHVHLTALRKVLKTAWRMGLMTAEAYQQASDIHDVKGEVIPKGRELSPGEISALFTVCEGMSVQGARDAALLSVLAGAGLRRFEVVGLNVADFSEQEGSLIVRRGKGRKDRITYLPVDGRTAVADWLLVRGDQPGPIFCPARILLDGRQVIDLKTRLSTGWVAQRVHVITELAGVKNVTTHDFRRTFATGLLALGVDIVLVQKLMGHGSVKTTAEYDRRREEAKKAAVEKLSIPYRKGT